MKMKKIKSFKLLKILAYIILFVGIITILFPFYLTIITAFKTPQESSVSFFAFPNSLYWDNFINVFKKAHYFMFFGNSIIITVISVCVILIIVPLCSYAIARNMKKKYYKIIYTYIIIGIFIPFQVIMIPLVKYLSDLHLSNMMGLILMHITLASSVGVFLLVNYIRTIPRDMEEAAVMDGCTTLQAYFKIVVPLLKPMLATIFVMNALWVWNDFQMPLLILNQSPDMWTLPLFQFNFKSQYTYDYNMAFSSYLIAMVPVMIVYATSQKYIVSGLTQGAVKS